MQGLKTVGLVCAGFLGAVVALFPQGAGAQSVTTLGQFNDWTAYTMTENGKKVCYVASQPKKDEGNYSRRGDIYVLVTHRPSDKQFNVVTVYAGYAYRPGSSVELSIDQTKFELFTEGETAWAHDEMDRRIVQEMRKGSSMVVRGTSARGTGTKDSYSLKGITAALSKINEACGVK